MGGLAFIKRLDLFRWLGFKGDRPKAVRQPDGYSKTTGPYGEVFDCDTLSCCHCGFTWEVVVGSGIERGVCHKCSTMTRVAYTCGKPECDVCIPFEQRLDNLEHGRDMLAPRPPLILVPAVPKRKKLIVP